MFVSLLFIPKFLFRSVDLSADPAADAATTLIAYCRDCDWLCPQPRIWQQLWETLPDRRRVGVVGRAVVAGDPCTRGRQVSSYPGGARRDPIVILCAGGAV